MTCVCVLIVVSSYLLRGVDDSGVVAKLQGANHSRADAHHQRKRYLLQDNRETGSAVSGDTGLSVTEMMSVNDTTPVQVSIQEGNPAWEPPHTHIRLQKEKVQENILVERAWTDLDSVSAYLWKTRS